MFFATNISADSARVADFIRRRGSGFDTIEEIDDFMQGAAEASNGFVQADICEEWFDDEGEGYTSIVKRQVIWNPPAEWEAWED